MPKSKEKPATRVELIRSQYGDGCFRRFAKLSATARRDHCRNHYAPVMKLITARRASKATWAEIADELNARGFKTTWNKSFTVSTVHRLGSEHA